MRWLMGLINRQHNTFKNGIHPPENKGETRGLPIRQFPFAPEIILPLSQHIGAPAKCIVREGQELVRGQVIAQANGYVSVPIHSPVSGIVNKIGVVPSISGKMVQGVHIAPFPFSGQEVPEGKSIELQTASPEEILQGVQDAGIVGLGGAAFPTHVKLKVPEGKNCKILMLNGIECEPFLTTDHRVMLEQANDIFMGIRYLLKATGAKRTIIGVEANKLDAAEYLRSRVPNNLAITIEVVPVKYPQGSEKMLIKSILGLEVPSGGLPIDLGIVTVNVATAAEIGRLLPHGRGIQERVITVTGSGVEKKGNYLIPIGTPLRFVLEYVGVDPNVKEVYMGGPMMGVAISNFDISVSKGTSGIVVFSKKSIEKKEKVHPCIKCGACLEACAISLNPSKLGVLAKFKAYEKMATQYNLLDCFECGACSYVCPSNIPLVQYFRIAKTIVKKRMANN